MNILIKAPCPKWPFLKMILSKQLKSPSLNKCMTVCFSCAVVYSSIIISQATLRLWRFIQYRLFRSSFTWTDANFIKYERNSDSAVNKTKCHFTDQSISAISISTEDNSVQIKFVLIWYYWFNCTLTKYIYQSRQSTEVLYLHSKHDCRSSNRKHSRSRSLSELGWFSINFLKILNDAMLVFVQ